jgi:hypothetical protein
MNGPRTHPEEKQPDEGYDESHGYGPAHGGPTGPGDAPAKKSPVPPPPREDDDEEEDE